jgi:MFS family permease
MAAPRVLPFPPDHDDDAAGQGVVRRRSALCLAGAGGWFRNGTLGVFFVPLVTHFGWTHPRVSLLSSVLFGCTGWIGPLVGWLLDRTEAAFVIVAGTALAAVGLALSINFLLASAGVLMVLAAGNVLKLVISVACSASTSKAPSCCRRDVKSAAS